MVDSKLELLKGKYKKNLDILKYKYKYNLELLKDNLYYCMYIHKKLECKEKSQIH